MGGHPSGPTLSQSVQRALHLVELVADSAVARPGRAPAH